MSEPELNRLLRIASEENRYYLHTLLRDVATPWDQLLTKRRGEQRPIGHDLLEEGPG